MAAIFGFRSASGRRTGVFDRYDLAELHCLRKTVARSPEDSLRIYLRQANRFVYAVVAKHSMLGARMATAWNHEEGIRADREIWTDREHPAHHIVCMTVLFNADTAPSFLSIS